MSGLKYLEFGNTLGLFKYLTLVNTYYTQWVEFFIKEKYSISEFEQYNILLRWKINQSLFYF
jgi:hypothetical protein